MSELEIKKRPCKKPCPECPFIDRSVPRYFGGNDPKIYAQALHSDTIVACHTKSKFNKEDEMVSDVVPCTGHLIAQEKLCKRNQHKNAPELLAEIKSSDFYEEFKADALGFNFYTHHDIDPQTVWDIEE